MARTRSVGADGPVGSRARSERASAQGSRPHAPGAACRTASATARAQHTRGCVYVAAYRERLPRRVWEATLAKPRAAIGLSHAAYPLRSAPQVMDRRGRALR